MEQALSAVPADQRGVDLCFYRRLSGITDERDQPLNGCCAHVLFLYIDRGQRGLKDRRKRKKSLKYLHFIYYYDTILFATW